MIGQVSTLALLLTLTLHQPIAIAGSSPPPTWTIVADDFESGTLDVWAKVSAGTLALVPGGGYNDSTGLSVVVGQQQAYVSRRDFGRLAAGYLGFWFNPNAVAIPDVGTSWPPGKSIRIATVKGSESWTTLVALRVRKPQGQGYKAYLEWQAPDGSHYDYSAGEFDLAGGWQKITLGFRVDDWVAVWLNDTQMQTITGVDHVETFGDIIEVGKTNSNSAMVPSGEIRFDDVTVATPRIDGLWVDAINGNDNNDGLAASSAFRTIQKAADLAGPGTTVHIQPGVYRETVRPATGGSVEAQTVYLAENGPGTAIIRGSEPASSLNWNQLNTNTIGLMPGVDPTEVYYTDLSAWNLNGPPQFIVALDNDGNTTERLPLAREPDWEVTTNWKYHEFWWAADGGSDVAGCNPAVDSDPDCDFPWRSTTQLTDRSNEAVPAGIPPGNLTTLGDLTGARLVALDTRQGHSIYWRTIVAHDIAAGRITVDEPCTLASADPGLGWGSNYYVEGLPGLLDTPGEWWYDAATRRLYLWPLTPGDPSSTRLEIARREIGINLSEHSYTTVDGLVLEFFNGTAILQDNSLESRSLNNSVRNVILRYAERGVYVSQGVGHLPSNITDGFALEDSVIEHIDANAIFMNYWSQDGLDPDSFTHAGIVNSVIRNNEFHHVGFRGDGGRGVGVAFHFADKFRFEGNHIHHIAHNGVQFYKSIIQSTKSYGFDPDEIKTGEILIKDNIFEMACQLTTDCGALKIWGDPPDNHVFRDVLVSGNVFRNTFGWTRVSEKRGRWAGGSGSEILGMGGSGLFVDMASGIHVHRNIAYNNAFSGFAFTGAWRDGAVVFYNNVAANSLHGLRLGGASFDTHGGSVNAQVANSVFVNNEGYGILQLDNDGLYGNLSIDHNLYYNNGWRAYDDGGLWKPGTMAIYLDGSSNQYHQTLGEIQANTTWEDHGWAGEPRFRAYDVNDHNLHDGSWSDFHLTADSGNAIDRGTSGLPASLTDLFTLFGLDESYEGTAYDIGRYEYETSFVKVADILLVADHYAGSSSPYAVYYTQALDDLGRGYDVWDTGLRGAPGSSILSQYTEGVVIWSVPAQSGYLGSTGVQSDLQAYLDGGGRLFISGQDVARMTDGSSFLRDYLHASFAQDSSGIQTLEGLTGDPIGDGLTLEIQGGDGADNQSSTDVIAPLGPAWPAFAYDDGAPAGTAGLRVNTGTSRIIYLSFGFEGIDSAADRAAVMQRALDWLAGASAVVQLDLSSGWNLNSWPVEPLIPAVDGALRAIDGLYCRVVGEGGVYDCELDPMYHTLTEIRAGQAYYLRVIGSSGVDLWLEGTYVPVSTPIPLHEFWNWAGYLPRTSLPIATALESIEGKYLMVHSIDKTYNPAEPLYSTLTHMLPGQGYLIRATEAVDLVYPADATSARNPPQQAGTGACDPVSPTPHFAVIYGEIAIGSAPAPGGTVVEVIDPSGMVAGCSVVRHPGHYGYIHVYGSEGGGQPALGLREGDRLTLRVNGAPISGPEGLRWSKDPTPHQVNLRVVRNPAHLPLIRGTP